LSSTTTIGHQTEIGESKLATSAPSKKFVAMNSTTAPELTGLIAGAGEVPLYFAQKAKKAGLKILAIAFTPQIQADLEPFVEKSYCIGVGKLDKIFKTLQKEQVRDLIILGKVDKSVIFRPQLFDLRSLKIITNLKNRGDKVLMEAVIEELDKEGLRLLDQRQFMPEIFPAKGVLTKRQPSEEEMKDVEFGLPIARKLADMEIGQTLVVKNQVVVAVEAVEGTNRAIERGCQLVQKAVVVKVSRSHQDFRYDSPGVGSETLQGMIDGKASVLALEAGCIMLLEQEKTLAMAEKHHISIICI
jgi:UDP-2,3-diacylglucosamine hydrolase